MAQRTPPSPDDGPARTPVGARGRMRPFVVAVWIVIAIALIGAVVFLHVSGAIGPGSH
jgi:hypothetical protein